jgi:very-short-patch-repair endonuclease
LIGRADLFYRTQGLVIEYDGGAHRDSLLSDVRRQNRIQNAGLFILRHTSVDYYRSPAAIVRQVRGMVGFNSEVPGAAAERSGADSA